MNTDRKITFEPDEWLYVRGSWSSGWRARRIAAAAAKHWRLSTERKMRAPYLSVVGP